jgi:hypothetical protein
LDIICFCFFAGELRTTKYSIWMKFYVKLKDRQNNIAYTKWPVLFLSIRNWTDVANLQTIQSA